ncbi:glucosaminidase domain-containing protein [Tissierella sp.]|uniref:glucosaminidase domain-containing protein n=1 Tax=Tissierella sp. TaxID=41274 RepID=UPI0028574E6B|nr:stalk domain-containing protein [Tissierella sp.]MDR7855057.1 stalk domain-containing protein [Tissierella sp.]
MGKSNNNYKIIALAMAVVFIFSGNFVDRSYAASSIRLVVDGKDMTSSVSPVIENSRTLVPIRLISEELGATVEWDNDNRTVLVTKGNKSIFLRIDSHLVEYNNGESYELSDVAPKIINGITFVPLRLVGNALEVGIDWDPVKKYAYVDSSFKSEVTPFFDVNIISHNEGQTVNGKTTLRILASSQYEKDGNEIRFLLLDPSTAKGFVIARGEQINGSYTWLPKIEENGKKVLVAAIYDKNGKFIAGDTIGVNVNVLPKIAINGISEGQIINNNIEINPDVNFVAAHVKYEITNLSKGTTTITEEQDPFGPYKWDLKYEDNGSYSIKAIAYDKNSNPYPSEAVNVQVALNQKLSLAGIPSGNKIDKPVSLIASRNFNANETEYLMRDSVTGVMTTLDKRPYGSYEWFPGVEYSGQKELIVRVKDTSGKVLESNPVQVTIDGTPKVLLKGVGPKQVVTGQTKINIISNVKLEGVNYTLLNSKTGVKKVLGANIDPLIEFKYTPTKDEIGNVAIQAEGIYQGKKILSESISFRVFLGETYGPKPIIEKDKFLGLASGLAKTAREKTGMSAAFQTAQAILETGWGQSVPVDKYTGVLSYNLFGIKGSGTAGSVTSNTWEVYNGVTYRVDADFRAYKSPSESWADHKEFLLTRERYEPVKQVMHDPAQATWAVKRAGYATDPLYSSKLMNIINRYNLLELDRVGI